VHPREMTQRAGCGPLPRLAGAGLFLVGPVEDNARADQEIVLVIVGGVGKGRRIVVDLNDAKCEARTHGNIDAAADASSKSVGCVADASDATAGM
jgi:hypothetical protein